MAEWSFDLEAAEEREDEVMLAFTAGDATSRVLAIRRWFDDGDKSSRTQRWASSFDGKPLPPEWEVYAWIEPPEPPDPAEDF